MLTASSIEGLTYSSVACHGSKVFLRLDVGQGVCSGVAAAARSLPPAEPGDVRLGEKRSGARASH